MPATRGKFSELLAPGLATIFFRSLTERKLEHPKWINEESSKRAYEEEWKLAGLGPFVRKAEGAVIRFDEPVPGDTVRYTHVTYALGFRVTMEMMEDDLYGIMNRMSSELGKSARVNKELQTHSVLNNGWTSTEFSGFDGLELFSEVHPNLGNADTQANEPATQADLSQPALQAAIETFENWTDDRGIPVVVEPKTLMVNPGDIWTAGELLQSEKDPDSANNAINVIRSRYGISDTVSHWLTDADAWFLFAAKSDHDVKMYRRKGDTFNNADDEITGDAIYTGHHRFSVGFSDWRGVYGSQGS